MFFNSIAKFNEYADSLSGIQWPAIKPTIAHAEKKFIIPLISKALYEDLEVKATANTATGHEAELIELLRSALASFAQYLYVPIAEVQLSDKGLRRGNSEAMPGAYKYQVENLRKALLDRGLELLEEAIDFLNTESQTEDKFVIWKASTAYTQYRSLFIANGQEFSTLYTSVKYPHRLFALLRADMFNVQTLTIAPAITESIYNALLAENKEDSPSFTAEETTLLQYLRYAIANLTIARGIHSIVASMDENGVHVLSSTTDGSTATSKRAAATPTAVENIVRIAESTGLSWLDKAVTYLNETATADIFPSWYTKLQAEATATAPLDNTTFKGIFSM
jgi:hypothetical protein